MLLKDLASASATLKNTRSRNKKRDALAAVLVRARELGELEHCVSYLSGELPQGKIGLGYAAVRDARCAPAEEASLTLVEVGRVLSEIKSTKGKGSKKRKLDLLGELMAAATEDEQYLLGALIVGELRQGALESLMAEAIAHAAEIDSAPVRRAMMFTGDLKVVAETAFSEGQVGLQRFRLQLFRPLQPMLASPADSAGAALEDLEEALLETKLDGARVQVHKEGDDVRVFTRSLHDVTHALPEVVDVARALPARNIVLDGEAIALKTNGRPHPFQTTMRRFGRRVNVDALKGDLPLSVFFFDVLYLDDNEVLDEPLKVRSAALESVIPAVHLAERQITSSHEEAELFFSRVLEQGHEGLVAKSLDVAYEAGRRGKGWLKIKPAHTLDLVVLAAEWGSGRRQGTLSNLHLGCRDGPGFAMLGKTFKGLSDELLRFQTEALFARETHREGHVVHVRPELVVEIAFDSVLESPHYPCGMALRFARVKGYRQDKTAQDAATLEEIKKIFDDGRR